MPPRSVRRGGSARARRRSGSDRPTRARCARSAASRRPVGLVQQHPGIEAIRPGRPSKRSSAGARSRWCAALPLPPPHETHRRRPAGCSPQEPACEQRALPDREARVDAEPGKARLGLLDPHPSGPASSCMVVHDCPRCPTYWRGSTTDATAEPEGPSDGANWVPQVAQMDACMPGRGRPRPGSPSCLRDGVSVVAVVSVVVGGRGRRRRRRVVVGSSGPARRSADGRALGRRASGRALRRPRCPTVVSEGTGVDDRLEA